MWISINISLKFFSKGPFNNIPALVQIMAWRRPGDKRLSEPMMVILLTHICFTLLQWVNMCFMISCHTNGWAFVINWRRLLPHVAITPQASFSYCNGYCGSNFKQQNSQQMVMRNFLDAQTSAAVLLCHYVLWNIRTYLLCCIFSAICRTTMALKPEIRSNRRQGSVSPMQSVRWMMMTWRRREQGISTHYLKYILR